MNVLQNDWLPLLQLLHQQHVFLSSCCREWLAGHASAGGQVFCRRGCSNCCNLAVHCTFAEALLVTQGLTAAQQEAVHVRAGRLRSALQQVTSLKDFLKTHRQQIGFCPFLDEQGACTIYENRPLACRSLLSTRDAQYCAVDFGELSREEVRAFIGGLDRTVVAFPSHYVAYSQQLGQELEEQARARMIRQFGFSLSGNLLFLIDLELELGLSSVIPQGRTTTAALLREKGAFLPYLLEFSLGSASDG